MFLKLLNKHVLIKKRELRANHASHVSMSMLKAIMRRSCLENVYFKKRTDKSLRAYRKLLVAGLTKRNVKNFLTN